jgi:CRISPR-associated protein Cas2
VFVVVSYDVKTENIAGKRRLRRVAKVCKDYGQRVQFSVFECIVSPDEWVLLKSKLLAEIKPEEDSLRFYFLGSNWKRRVEHIGAKKTVDLEGPLII